MIAEAFLVTLTLLNPEPNIVVPFTDVQPIATWEQCQEQKESINKNHNVSDIRWQCAHCTVNPFQE